MGRTERPCLQDCVHVTWVGCWVGCQWALLLASHVCRPGRVPSIPPDWRSRGSGLAVRLKAVKSAGLFEEPVSRLPASLRPLPRLSLLSLVCVWRAPGLVYDAVKMRALLVARVGAAPVSAGGLWSRLCVRAFRFPLGLLLWAAVEAAFQSSLSSICPGPWLGHPHLRRFPHGAFLTASVALGTHGRARPTRNGPAASLFLVALLTFSSRRQARCHSSSTCASPSSVFSGNCRDFFFF